MKACIKVVSAPALSFTGTVTVTGVVDKDGNPFTPIFAQVYGNSDLNTLKSQSATPAGAVSLYWLYSAGWDDATTHRGVGTATGSRFGLKLTCAGQGPYSIMSEIPDVFFGGAIARQAYISAFRSGEFDITYVQNDYTGDSFVVVLFGGADLQMGAVIAGATSVINVGWAPSGVIYTGAYLPSSSSSGSSVSAGAAWAAKNSGQGATVSVSTPSSNSRIQSITAAPYTQSTTGFTSTGVTLSGIGYSDAAIFIGGTQIRCTSGSFTTITGTGTQTIDLGVDPRLVYMASAGAAHLSSADTSEAEHCIGGYDRVNQFSHWVAESATSNPPNGARFLSNATILQFGTPNTLSSAITATAAVTGVSGTEITLSWSLNDGVAREVIWFAIGSAADATIDLSKVWADGSTGQTTLQIGTTPGGDDIASQLTGSNGGTPLSVSVADLAAGTYYVSETGGVRFFTQSISCTSNGAPLAVGEDGEIVVEESADVVCTITNTPAPAATRTKQWKLYGFNMKLRKEERS